MASATAADALAELGVDASVRNIAGMHRFERVFELQDDEREPDTEIASLLEFRTRLLRGAGRAVLVEDRLACQEKRVLKVVRNLPLYRALMTLHNHPHLCRVHELVPLNNGFAALQQFASHGSLRALLSYLPDGALSEINARLLFQQLVMAVDYLVRKGITEFMVTLDTCFLHRDGAFPTRFTHRLATTSQPVNRARSVQHRNTQTSSDVWRTLELESMAAQGTANTRPPRRIPTRPHSPDDLTADDLRVLLDPRPFVDPYAPAESLLRHPALYCPPEVLRGGGPVCEAGIARMLGVVLHCMLTGSFPFVQASTWATAMRAPVEQVGGLLAADLLQQPLVPQVVLSPGAVALLGALLQRDPARRPAIGNLFREQPWVAQEAPLGALQFNDGLVAMGAR